MFTICRQIAKRKVFTAFLFSLIFPVLLSAQGKLDGHWEGHIDILGDQLEVLIDFQRSGDFLKGDISIPAQNIRDLALTNIRLAPDSAEFMISEVGGDPTFLGRFEGEHELSGKFIQYGQEFRFMIEKEVPKSSEGVTVLKGLDTVIEKNLEAYRVPGLAIAVVVDNEVVYSRGFGLRDMERQNPVTPNTLFAIGSSTKAFTTFTLASLVDEGIVEWDRPVREYIPWFRMSEDELSDHLTVRDLVTHRSGLPRHDLLWYNNDEYSREEFVRALRYLETNAGLRERFQYNNLMYLTAGYLTEQLTGKSWEENVRKRIFEPLGMERSNFSVSRSKRELDYAMPYREQSDSLLEMPFRKINTVGPAGSINSSVNEMSHWIKMQLNGGRYEGSQLLNPALVEDMHTPYMIMGGGSPNPSISHRSYGLGWMIDTWRGHKRVEHGGNIDGFSALVTLFPEDGFGLVILTNKNGSVLPSYLSQHIADRLFEMEQKPWLSKGLNSKQQAYTAMEISSEKKQAGRRTGSLMSHELTDYAGTYTHPAYGRMYIDYVGDSLYMKYHNIKTSLQHWHYDVFNGKHSPDPVFVDMKLQFNSNLDGYVSTLRVPLEQAVEPIEFEKRPDDKWFESAFIERFTGTYSFMGQTVTVRRVAGELRVKVPGQPEYTLVPTLGDQFYLKDYPSIQVLFRKNEAGEFVMIFDQPQGRFEAEAVEE